MKLPKKMLLDVELPVVKLVTLKEEQCQNRRTRASGLSLIVEALSDHSARIGAILPLSGIHAQGGQAIIAGMRSVYPFRGVQFQDRVLTRDTRGLLHNFEQNLAELVFKQRISVLIGGYTKQEARLLERWGRQLRIPTIVLNQKQDAKVMRNVFHVFPDARGLVDRLVSYAHSKGYQSVGILHPIDRKGRKLSGLLSEGLKQVGIKAEHNYVYDTNDFDSMLAAAKKVFHIDPVERADEFRELITAAKEKAVEAGLPFNPSLVALSPILDVDAIFIDDNFRTVRHFTKLFEFLGVKHIQLLGTPQWRARGLIEPHRPFLEGAVFVDYIGDYRHLPRGIHPPVLDKTYFVEPEASSRVDYMVIGHHAVRIADRSLSQPIQKRRLLYKRITELSMESSAYFKRGKIFDQSHRSIWPSFMFQVGRGEIVPVLDKVKTNRQARTPKSRHKKTHSLVE